MEFQIEWKVGALIKFKMIYLPKMSKLILIKNVKTCIQVIIHMNWINEYIWKKNNNN